MIRLSTEVDTKPLKVRCCLNDRIMLLGSCFSDEMASRLKDGGFNVCANPFGTLYNPASIASAVARLDSAEAFTEADCMQMGAGAGLVCSFSHHTSFARKTPEEFLAGANESLASAVRFWKDCNKVIITLGTAYVWEHVDYGVVSNCLKRDAKEFSHHMLDATRCGTILKNIVATHPDKEFIFTVSPIRHMSLGAHENTLSKATLHLALQNALSGAGKADYFPAFEILCDELRDYRFYAEDLAHPSKTAVSIIWERFLESAVPANEHNKVALNEKSARQAHHVTNADKFLYMGKK